MVPVYICDDNKEIRSYMEAVISKFNAFQEYDFSMELSTDSGDKLLDIIQEKKQRGVYFLDVDLGEEQCNGFELGAKIRELDTRGFIIFITTHNEMLMETFRYRLEAMDYIVKDEPTEIKGRMEQCLFNIHQKIEKEIGDIEYFHVKVGSKTSYIPLQEILFFETSPKKHVIILHTQFQMIEFFDNLQKIEETVGNQFLRVHRSYLVNKEWIEEYSSKSGQLTIRGGKTCMVSRTGRKILKENGFA